MNYSLIGDVMTDTDDGGLPGPSRFNPRDGKGFEVDRASPVPLYEQVRAGLERWIGEATAVEDEVPNETRLGELFGVSRITIRQALSLLVADGVLYRRRSRGPLYVAPRRVHQQIARLHGFFTDDVLSAGMDSQTVVLHVGCAHDARAAQLLDRLADNALWRAERLHIGDGTPMALQVSYLPAGLFPDLAGFDLSRSLLALIEDRYGRRVARAAQRLRARRPVPRERTLLRLPPSGFVVEVERVSYDQRDVAVEYFSCVLPAERYDFTIDLSADEPAGGAERACEVFASRTVPPPGDPGVSGYGHVAEGGWRPCST